MTIDNAIQEPPAPAPATALPDTLLSLEAWSMSAPIRLAGYEDDLAEPHILNGID